MTLLELLVRTPFARAAGWALFHSLWQGAAIAAILSIALLSLRDPRHRYPAAWGALLLTTFVFLGTLVYEWPQAAISVTRYRPAWFPDAIGNRELSAAVHSANASNLLPWIVPLWLFGVVLSQARGALGWLAVTRLRNRGTCVAPQVWIERLSVLRTRMKVGRSVVLLESCFARVPVAVGYLRPLIIVPVGLLAAMPASHIEAILLHELAHIRRGDYLANALQTILEGLLFYNPCVWWISGVIRSERENCCDDLAVSQVGDRRVYAMALTSLEEERVVKGSWAIASNGGNLVNRIRRVLFPAERRVLSIPVSSAALLALLGSVALLAWQAIPNPVAPSSAAQTASTPWERWVNEEVVYIIQPDERQAFLRLETDPERQHFIEQFWERRDPTPGTPPNEMKEEHYRRLAYVDSHFSWGSTAGWKTDRGRIYIAYGPPNEIESHPSGGNYKRPDSEGGGTASTAPFEQWRYRWIERVGNDVLIDFVDKNGDGSYQMTRDPNEKYVRE